MANKDELKGYKPFGGYKGRRKRGRPRRPSGPTASPTHVSVIQEHYKLPPIINYSEIDDYFRGLLDIKLTEDEERRLLVAKEAWEEALMYYFNPGLPDPNFVFDHSKTIGFFIKNDTWQVFMNLPQAPELLMDKELKVYYEALALHEISHHIICPYDTITNGRLLAAALSKVSEYFAPIVVNIFADLLIDTKLYREKPDIMLFEFKKTQEMIQNEIQHNSSPESKISKLLTRCYQIMWGLDVDVDQEKYGDVEPIAQKVAQTILKNFNDFTTWEKKVKRVAALIKDLIADDLSSAVAERQRSQGGCTGTNGGRGGGGVGRGGGGQGQGLPLFGGFLIDDSDLYMDDDYDEYGDGAFGNGESEESPENQGHNGGKKGDDKGSSIPKDVEIIMGDPFEIKTNIGPESSGGAGRGSPSNLTNRDRHKNPDKNRELTAEELERIKEQNEKDAEQLARDLGFRDFQRVNRILKLVPADQVYATYYRAISKNLIQIKIVDKKPSGSIPIGIEPWRIGEPIEDLDILQSILVSPRVIPNITTRKWIYKHGPGIELNEEIPDMLLVIDSSGSMDWVVPKTNNSKNNSPYHIALVACFAALHYAIKQGAKVSAINFSGYFKTQKWTFDSRKIEKVLLKYMGDGTVLPTKEIVKMVKNAERKTLIILITDFDIANWGDAYNELLKLLENGHKLVGFFIGGSENEIKNGDFSNLITLGARFYPIKKIGDLIGLVIKEVKDAYNL